MKKFVYLIGVLTLLFGATAHAKTTDMVGNIYETDIKATINDIIVPSYNIGGRTAIVVEDATTAYSYNNDLRVLLIHDFAPNHITSQTTRPRGSQIGDIIGDIYATNIKTYFCGKEINAYSLDGKMAVCIEDLGGDNEFNSFGGRYIWNPEERTISLESLYFQGAPSDALTDAHVNMIIDENFNATFESHPIMYGSLSWNANPPTDIPIPITHGETIVGYIFDPKLNMSFHLDDNGKYSLVSEEQPRNIITYFYDEKIREILKDYEVQNPTRADWLAHYENQLMTVISSFETEEYTFLYMSQNNTHGSSQFLNQVFADGTVISYDLQLQPENAWGNKHFKNVVFDIENQKVTFTYDIDYEIDLAAKKLIPIYG